MTQINDLRGSVWRKWDLHVHSPKTHLANGFGDCTIDDFVNAIVEKEISAIGLTNYFRFADDEIEEITQKLNEKGVVVFPNLEFRTQPQNQGGEEMHIHLIFSDKLALKKINNFLGRLKTIDDKYCGNLTQSDIEETSIAFDTLLQKLHEDKEIKHLDDYLIVACPRGQGSFRPSMTDDGRGANLAVTIDQKTDALFGKIDDREFFLNPKRYTGAIPKPVLFCSDTHKKKDIGAGFTWVKADLSFEGLKQVIYEPQERVRIQEENPSEARMKPFFDSISIIKDVPATDSEDSVQFQKRSKPLLLNHNLVSIIGGRGSGKSLILEYFANVFGGANSEGWKNNRNFSVKHFFDDNETNYVSGNNNHLPDFLYINQGNVRKVVENPEAMSQTIQDFLRISELTFDQQEQIDEIVEAVSELKNWFGEKDDKANLINTEDFINEEIKRYGNFLGKITTTKNKEKLTQYTKNINRQEFLKIEAENLERIKRQLESFASELHANEHFAPETKDFGLPAINFGPQYEKINEYLGQIKTEVFQKEKENEDIKKDFAEYKGDLTSLLQNASQYEKKLTQLKVKKTEIGKKRQELVVKQASKKNIATIIQQDLKRQKEIVDAQWAELKRGEESWTVEQTKLMNAILNDQGVEIFGEIVFDIETFYEMIEEKLDGRKLRKGNKAENIKNFLGGVDSYDSFIKLLENDPSTQVNEEILLDDMDNFEKLLYSQENREKYLYATCKITYRGKELKHISIGQRGTVYLCLKLATNAFSSPLIFDQPEDDLDNAFIIQNLVDILKSLKKYRQIIIATHNANLVINADSEQIIVACNKEEVLSYDSGSIENPGIIKKACEILEGGKEAFEKRQRKYHL